MENTSSSPEKTPAASSSREPLFGVLLLILMVVLILGFLFGLAWTGYSSWKTAQQKKSTPSIAQLEQDKAPETPQVKEDEPKKTEENKAAAPEQATDSLTKAKNTDIKVLNGGAAKGSATALTEMLKKNGYLKVTALNSLSDYTGTKIYFATGLDKEADAVKTSMLTAYPKTVTAPASAANKETSEAPLTIILGK